MLDAINFTHENQIGVITLNRADALNALTLPMILAMQSQLEIWQTMPSVHAVVLRAVEGKAFCAGGDVRWLYEMGHQNLYEQKQFFWHEYRLNHFIHCFPKPYIGLMDGITMGGGVGISLHGSHPVATSRFIFAMPETSIGFFPDVGASYLLARCPDSLGMYLGLTGNRLNADEAKALGLVHTVISHENLNTVYQELITTDLSLQASVQVDAILKKWSKPSEEFLMDKLLPLVNQCFNFSDVESMISALHLNDDEWHVKTRQNLSKKSPLSLKITCEELNKAKSLTLSDCLKMDYQLVNHFMRGHDFYEGVRSLLIHKDNAPCWEPSSLSSVSTSMVATYFEELDNGLELL